MRIKKKLTIPIVLLIAGVFYFYPSFSFSPTRPGKTSSLFDRISVGAYYYLWYPKNIEQGIFRQTLIPDQKPRLGWYNSADIPVIEQHIDWCAEYGIQFLALNFWPDKPEQNQLIDQAFLKAKNIQDIRFCIFYESWGLGFDGTTGDTPFREENIRLFIKDMEYLADHYFNHPSYFKINNRPVVILYLTRTFTGQFRKALEEARAAVKQKGFDLFLIGDEIFWDVSAVPSLMNGFSSRMTSSPQKERIRLFDAITGYNLYESAKADHQGYPRQSQWIKESFSLLKTYQKKCPPPVKLFPGLIPGYNDRGTRPNENHYVIPRKASASEKEGSTFELLLDEWIFPLLDPEAPVFLITSFNEWNEDTGIEPLNPCPATSRDIGTPDGFFSGGYAYEGFDLTYLELLRNKTIAVTGIVTNNGKPVSGMRITACQNNKAVAADFTDSRGRYLLSRLYLKEGEYSLHAEDSENTQILSISPERTTVLSWDLKKISS